MDSKSIQCGFESHRGHVTDPQPPRVIGARLTVTTTCEITDRAGVAPAGRVPTPATHKHRRFATLPAESGAARSLPGPALLPLQAPEGTHACALGRLTCPWRPRRPSG